MEKEYKQFQSKVLMHLNKVYQECGKETFELRGHVFYERNNKTCKLQIPTTNSLPPDMEKEVMHKFIEKTFTYVQSPYGAFATEAYVTGIDMEKLSEEQQAKLKSIKTQDGQEEYLASLPDSVFDKKEDRVIVNFMVSNEHKSDLKKSIMIFDKKWQGGSYLLVPERHHKDGDDSVKVGGRFNDLM